MVGVGVALGILAKLAVMVLDTLLDLVPVVSRDSFRGDLYSIRYEVRKGTGLLLVTAGFLHVSSLCLTPGRFFRLLVQSGL